MTTPENKPENKGATPAVATSLFARSVASLKEAISYGFGDSSLTVADGFL